MSRTHACNVRAEHSRVRLIPYGIAYAVPYLTYLTYLTYTHGNYTSSALAPDRHRHVRRRLPPRRRLCRRRSRRRVRCLRWHRRLGRLHRLGRLRLLRRRHCRRLRRRRLQALRHRREAAVLRLLFCTSRAGAVPVDSSMRFQSHGIKRCRRRNAP